MVYGKKKPSPDPIIEHFARSDNDQNDVEYLECVQKFLGPDFKLFQKSVCFTDLKNKLKFRGYVSQETCVTISTFKRHSGGVADLAGRLHVAVVEGTIGRVQRTRGGPIVPHWGEFHSCLVMVDKIFKRIYVHNPWQEGHARSRTVKALTDIRPRLVMTLVKCLLADNYDVYHYSGKQVHTSDCRIHLLHFAKRLGIAGRNGFHKKIMWRKLTWSQKA